MFPAQSLAYVISGGGGFMMDTGKQIPVLPPRQKDCHYKALPSYELGAPRKLSNGYL